jgi:hypothetical protein
MLFRFFIVEVLFIFLMVAHFVGINSEAAGFACRHEFAALLEEIYQLGSRHPFCRASAETLFGTETPYYGVDELLFCCVTIALHHVENFMSMCHIYILCIVGIVSFPPISTCFLGGVASILPHASL